MNPQLEALVGCGIAGPVIPRAPRCIVPVCHSRVAPSSILYPLPTVPSLRQAWIDFVRACPCGGACDWEPPTGEISLVCSLHFTKIRVPRILQVCNSVIHELPANRLQDKMEANVKGSGSQHRGMRIEAAVEMVFPKDASTQCSLDVASKTTSCGVRTVSKAVQYSG
ncbi:hypothetical protein MRX96_056993 [Rhipicephalus microplus]